MSDTPQLLSTKRVRCWGGSHVVTLSKEVREALQLKEGDTVAFRRYGRYVVLAVVRVFTNIPMSQEEAARARAALGA